QVLLERFACPAVSLSEPFEDGFALLRVARLVGCIAVFAHHSLEAPLLYVQTSCAQWRSNGRYRLAQSRLHPPACLAERTSEQIMYPVCPPYCSASRPFLGPRAPVDDGWRAHHRADPCTGCHDQGARQATLGPHHAYWPRLHRVPERPGGGRAPADRKACQ